MTDRRYVSPENRVRAREWADARIAGETLAQIGDREGLSRERIRQVIRDAGLSEKVAVAKAAQRFEVEEARRAEVASERAAMWAVRKLTVAETPFNSVKQFSDADLVEALRVWIAGGGSGVISDWDGPPSSATITRRLGWAKAVREAGGMSQSPAVLRRDRWSEADALAAVVAFLRDPAEGRGGAVPYSDWARARGKPSDQTVRNRFGSWGAAKRAALEVIRSDQATSDGADA